MSASRVSGLSESCQLYSCTAVVEMELQLGAVYTQYAVAELCIANAVPCRAGPVAVPDVSGRSDDQYVKGMNVESNAIQFQNHVICHRCDPS